MALKRHRRMRANPVELLVVNPGLPRRRHMNPEWARSLGRGMYRGAHYAAESARDLYEGAREARRARLAPTTPVKNPGSKKKGSTVAKPKRDTKGRFKKNPSPARKKKAKSKGAKSRARARRRRAAAKAPAVKAVRRRRRRAKKAAPAVKAVRRRRRRVRKSPAAKVVRRRRRRASPVKRHAKRRHRRNPLSQKFQKRAKRTVSALRKRLKKAPKRSLRRRALSAQLRRASAIMSLAKSRSAAKKIRPAVRGLQHAMMTKSNPGMAGVIASFKILAPQAAVGGVGLVGLAVAGKYVADMLTKEESGSFKASMLSEGKPTMLAQYAPALSTAALSAVAYVVADKVAPRYKGAVAIGGMIGAIVQAVMVMAEGEDKTSFAAKTKAALLPIPGVAAPAQPAAAPDAKAPAAAAAAAAVKGFGEYTTVGAGIFHGVGEYTTIGTGADNATEFAADSLRGLGEYTTVGSGIFHGLDDATEFAPGEGGILSGGIFR